MSNSFKVKSKVKNKVKTDKKPVINESFKESKSNKGKVSQNGFASKSQKKFANKKT